jgi:hypothetical protein
LGPHQAGYGENPTNEQRNHEMSDAHQDPVHTHPIMRTPARDPRFAASRSNGG